MFCVVIDLCKKLYLFRTVTFKHGIVYNKNIGTVFRIQWKNSVVYDSGCKDCSKTHPQIPIDYACGWAISTDEGTYTLQMLLDKADSDMYENKQLCKKRNLGSRQ